MPAPRTHARIAARTLELTTFRNYPQLRLDLDGRCCVVTGPNGAGKTNLLEALSLLVPGRGLRRAALRDLPQAGAGGFTVFARFATPDGERAVGTSLAAGAERREVHVDGMAIPTSSRLAEITAAVWLTPAMDRLFVEGTASRRRFLDRLVHAGDPTHARQLARYEHLIRERSKLLRGGHQDGDWLTSLERQAAEAGTAIAAARLEVTTELNRRLAARATPFPVARLHVRGEVEERLRHQAAIDVEDWLSHGLAGCRDDDRLTGGARIGPHRSDLEVHDVELASPAGRLSTGRQKALLVGLVLAESHLGRDRSGRWPLLLLDEVGAHLDRRRRSELVHEILATGAQAWLTGTEPDGFEPLEGHAQFLTVDQAKVMFDDR
ncbi:MAG: DNA replication/repair protein RecF [Geminicoccaceae bacterium]|nr:MAG: DNA replication/repair protein RecF [Geminicoccaceae bacterium]